ncbi:MAG: ATP-binding domain-containing protein [Candidatus Protistobacter heckmanni]|nr:ATP-binding domain-containing protein [Candidatus Protistobacter heckmanni]
MAQIYPSGWRELAVAGAAQREIETLSLLAQGLPANCTVYHGVHWTNVERRGPDGGSGYSVYGEIDFVVIGPEGAVLLIEQKSGFLDETPEGLVKRYAGREKSVPAQMQRTLQVIRTKLARAGLKPNLEYLLYCPDHLLKQPEHAGLDPTRIVDARTRDKLARTIGGLVHADRPAASSGERAGEDAVRKLRKFFADELSLSPDPSAMLGQAEAMVTRVSGGLATWARRLEMQPLRLRVEGTAGSGKTQLALALIRDALDAGQRPLYVCFNRPLADHIQRLVGEDMAAGGGRIATFHMLGDAFAREQGIALDYGDAQVWKKMETVLAEHPLPPAWVHDVLIVDEGQDFSEPWRDALLRLLKPEGKAVWLEDPMQNLYDKAPVALPGWPVLRAPSNYRSPRQVVGLLADLGATGIEAASPFLSAEITVFEYDPAQTESLFEATKQAITHCLAGGFARKDIALISYRGRENSEVLPLEKLGPHTLHAFTGGYDLFGNPLYREGELLAETVYRFKGQSAPAVVLTEIDFEALDERALRKLFVGMTRSRLKLALVTSSRAANLLSASLEGS